MAVGFVLITTEPGAEVSVREAVSKIEHVSGLGLAISSDIIKSHGGDINFSESNLGGLKVMISLPV